MQQKLKNRALIFIKPHAATPAAMAFVRQFLDGWKVSLSEPVRVTGTGIAAEKTIDKHYFAIAKTAVESAPAEYSLSDDAKARFASAYGIDWEEAIDKGRLLNAVQTQKQLGDISGIELNDLWKQSRQVKLAPGLYAGDFSTVSDTKLFCINGFYPGQREVFTDESAEVILFEAEFDPGELDWERFRSTVIGATDPASAKEGSLRAQFLSDYQKLDMKEKPEMSRNGVHASAGPIEGLRERMVWLGVDPHTEPLVRELNRLGLDRSCVNRLLENERILLGDKNDLVFDLTEDMNAAEAASLLSTATFCN